MEFNSYDELKKKSSSLRIQNLELISSYKKGYIGKNVFKVTLEDGTSRYAEQILKNGRDGDAVVIIPITEAGKFVMVVQSRPNTRGGVLVEFPAGMVDEGEDPITAARRELLEETGYLTNNLRELEWHYQDQGCSRAVVRTFIAEDCKKICDIQLDAFEKLEPVVMTYDDIESLMHGDSDFGINDANSKIAFYEYTYRRK